MKKSIASVISVAGVLGAGAAAYAVNTSVLNATSSNNLAAVTAPVETFGSTDPADSSGTVGGAGIAVAPPAAATPATVAQAPAAVPPTTAASANLTPVAVAPLSSTPVAASSLTTYKVGTAGSVVIDAADGLLAVASATPAAGWTARKVVHGSTHSEVVFSSSTMKVYFEATLSNGFVLTSVRSEAVAPPVTVRPPRHDDDDDDDRYEDHDDDHDEEDD
jgi:hypothetical protein